ncbi:VWA domain-containing protein [Peristeroidobacter soli]|uniref:VWA domain-containing protein n=1 Tax=Peristeroidobacter soli TaxID=2497877 RepID=UPI00101D0B09|nr:VWA domain-containing protein [Peristeroidobacter soli]
MPRRHIRRETEVFSISFLDCITCGLGSVILLLVLSNVRSPAIEEAQQATHAHVLNLQDQLVDIRGESEILNRDLRAQQEQLADEKARIARLYGDLSALRGKFSASNKDSDAANKIQGQLVAAREKLTEEMKRLYAGPEFKHQNGDIVGGVPIDSEYVVFIIDTSGSMFNYAWPMMLQSMQEILNIYPHLKGIQVTNDVGTPMFSGYQGKWINDTPEARKMVLDRLRTWNAFSASNPSQGIVSAIRTYWAADKKISLYVFGDEFTGPSIDTVVKTVDMVNRTDQSGERRVRIHAIGFPVTPLAPQYTSIRFATMMRIICQKNNGTFVGMHEADNRGPRFKIS